MSGEIFEGLLQPRVLDHDKQVHAQRIKTNEDIKDPSCVLCNPIRTTPKKDFWNFWKWYGRLTGAETYTEKTIKVFYKKEITTELDSMEEITQKVVNLIETMRYHPRNEIEIKTENLVRKVTLTMIQSDWFMEKIEDEKLGEISDDNVISIASTVSSMTENEDRM